MSLTFIIDCPYCKAKVAALEKGRAERHGMDHDLGEPWGEMLQVGICPSCLHVLAGQARQIAFENYDSPEDEWSFVTRVFPNPPKAFSSPNIPRVVTTSLTEADRSMQAGANIAACVMFGRALEALCRDRLSTDDKEAKEPNEAKGTGATKAQEAKATKEQPQAEKPKRKLMLGEGIRGLRDREIIDNRLYEWSQQLQAFRNLAAHPEDISISREDAEDLQSFVHAIVEYVYDLTEKYDDFKARLAIRAKRKKK